MEGSKLYIGNLSYAVTSEQLKELFSTMRGSGGNQNYRR